MGVLCMAVGQNHCSHLVLVAVNGWLDGRCRSPNEMPRAVSMSSPTSVFLAYRCTPGEAGSPCRALLVTITRLLLGLRLCVMCTFVALLYLG